MMPSSLFIYTTLLLSAGLKSSHGFQFHATSQHNNNQYCRSHRMIGTQIFANNDERQKISTDKDTIATPDSSFGESVPYVPLSQRTNNNNNQGSGADTSNLLSVGLTNNNSNKASPSTAAAVSSIDETTIIKQNRIRNIIVAIASFAVAIFNYGWQFTHPVTAIEILTAMERESAPLTVIGNNGKPTVIDFW